jgi:hypothetical protein
MEKLILTREQFEDLALKIFLQLASADPYINAQRAFTLASCFVDELNRQRGYQEEN